MLFSWLPGNFIVFWGEHKSFYFQLLHFDILHHSSSPRDIILWHQRDFVTCLSEVTSSLAQAESMFESCNFHKPHVASLPSPAGYSRLVVRCFLCGSWGECSNSICLPDHSRSKLLDAEHFTATLRASCWLEARIRKWINKIWITAHKLYLSIPSKWFF